MIECYLEYKASMSALTVLIEYPTGCLSQWTGVGGGEKRQGGKRQKFKKKKNLPVYRHDYLCIKSKIIYKKLLEPTCELGKLSGYRIEG